jgi:hypothetical protein
MKKQPKKERTCKERVQEHWDSRKADFQKFMDDENAGLYEGEDMQRGLLTDYILSVDKVEARPIEYIAGVSESFVGKHLQHAPYDRIQISYGGPTEEIRYYEDGLVEFVLLDWYDSAVVLLNHQQLDCTHGDAVRLPYLVTAHEEDEQIAEFLHQYFIGEPLEE